MQYCLLAPARPVELEYNILHLLHASYGQAEWFITLLCCSLCIRSFLGIRTLRGGLSGSMCVDLPVALAQYKVTQQKDTRIQGEWKPDMQLREGRAHFRGEAQIPTLEECGSDVVRSTTTPPSPSLSASVGAVDGPAPPIRLQADLRYIKETGGRDQLLERCVKQLQSMSEFKLI